MSILLTIISVIAGLIILLLLIAMFIKREYTIEREISIGQPVQQVFNYIKYLKTRILTAYGTSLTPPCKKTIPA